MHSPWLARPAQYVMGLVGLRGLSPLPGPPSVLWGPGACLRSLGSPLCCGARVYLLWLPGPPSVSRGLCTLSLSPRAHPLHLELVLLLFRLTSLHSLLQGLGVLLLAPQTHSLCREVCVHCRGLYVSPLSAPRPTLCTASVVCTGRVCMPGHSRTSGPTLCTTRAVCTGEVYMLPQTATCALERFVCLPSLGAPSPLSGREHSPCLFSAL